MKTSLLIVALVAALSLTAAAQEMSARAYANARGLENRGSPITLTAPHACTLSKAHPCVYYGADINASDPVEDGLSNENTVFIPDSFTFTEVNSPVAARITAAFSNNLSTYGILDPQTATWFYRTGMSEGNAGTLLCSGDSPATITDTNRNAFGFEEYEVLTKTPCALVKGNNWFAVTPDCTNANDSRCTSGRYFESDTNGPNAINGAFTQTSNTDWGPMLLAEVYFGGVYSWCNDQGVACGDGMSAGL